MIATPPHAAVLRSNAILIRTATEPLEISQLRAVLDEQHYLKAGRPAGHVGGKGRGRTIRKAGSTGLSPSFAGPVRPSASRTVTNGSVGTR